MHLVDIMKHFVGVLTLLSFNAPSLHAQALFTPSKNDRSFGIEVVKPHLVKPNDWVPRITHTYLASALFFQVRAPLTTALTVVTDLPLTHVSGRADVCVDASCLEFVHGTALGNPYLGAELGSRSGVLTFGFGARLPLQRASWLDGSRWDGIATAMGFFGDHVDRVEAFLPGVTTLSGHARARIPNEQEHLQLQAFLRPMLLYHPDAEGYIHDRDGKTSKVHIHFGSLLGWQNGAWRTAVGSTGRNWLTHSLADEKTYLQAFALAGYDFSKVGLTATARYPLGHSYSRLVVDRSFTLAIQLPL